MPFGWRRLIVAGLAASLCGPWGVAQLARNRPPGGLPEATASPKINLRVDSNLVLAPAVVYNSNRGPVTGLQKENFRIYEDNVEQTITSFSLDDQPLTSGDAATIVGPVSLTLTTSIAAELILIDVPLDFEPVGVWAGER